MTQKQYKRKISLIVSNQSGDGLDLSELRIVFDIKLTDSQTPNTCQIRVYNISRDLVARIKKEYTVVTLQAGYESNYGTIFEGNIKQVIYGSENQTETFMDMAAGDGDSAYNYAVVNKTLSSGATQEDIINESLTPMADHDVSKGYVADTGSQQLPRGKVMYGMSREYLRKVANNTQTTYSIQAGKFQLVKLTGVLPGEAIVLSSKTGMIGTSDQTNDGILVTCLLNPNLKIGGSVHIDEKSVQEELIEDTDNNDQVNTPSPISEDGFYRIYTIEYEGDTRGNDWYAKMTCLSMDKTQPLDNQVTING